MIRISDAAQAHFAKLLANQEEGTQIRVFVINPGTPNAECGVSYCPPDAVEATDTALKFDLLTAYVDELSAPYLEDAEIDFVTDQLGSQLTLKAPNAKMRKVADDAPLMERVEYMLQSQINPQLAGHGRLLDQSQPAQCLPVQIHFSLPYFVTRRGGFTPDILLAKFRGVHVTLCQQFIKRVAPGDGCQNQLVVAHLRFHALPRL